MNKDKKLRIFTRRMQKKLALLFLFIVLALIGLNVRLTYINAKSGKQYAKKVLSQQQYDSRVIPYRRGDIKDRNGTVLATSEKVYNVILDCGVVNADKDYVDPTVKALVECFSLDETQLRTTLSDKKDSHYVVLLKKQTYDAIQKFVELQNDTKKNPNIKGVWFEAEYQRQYPYNSLASQALGFTVSGNVGNWGIEQYYNEQLNGTNGREYGFLNSDSDLEVNTVQPVDGDTVISTIDYTIQGIVEKHIKAFNEAHKNEFRQNEDGSKQTAVIVMDPNSGEILAMADKDGYDLNNPRDLSAYYTQDQINAMSDDDKIANLTAIWKNYCISSVYEPGSTAKPFTISAGLDSGKLTGNETYYCPGYEMVYDRLIKCNKTTGHGQQTLKQVLENSCNVGLMEIGATIGADTFRKYQAIFNLGMKTGIDLPGEEAGIVYGDSMGPVDLATNAFGQNFNVTMVQMAAGFSSVINGGTYYRPHIVDRIEDANGAVVKSNDSVELRQTISSETSKKMKDMLYGVVSEGTGKAAQIAGYSIGGKTGTAEKQSIEGRDKTNYVISFIGFAPVDDPQVVIYTVIDEPNLEKQAQSKYATELTKDMLTEILPYMNIYPDQDTSSSSEDSQTATESSTQAPTTESSTQAVEPSTQTSETSQESSVEGSEGDNEDIW